MALPSKQQETWELPDTYWQEISMCCESCGIPLIAISGQITMSRYSVCWLASEVVARMACILRKVVVFCCRNQRRKRSVGRELAFLWARWGIIIGQEGGQRGARDNCENYISSSNS